MREALLVLAVCLLVLLLAVVCIDVMMRLT